MASDEEFVLTDELRAQREKLRAVVGIDEWVIDLITMACERIEELEGKKPTDEELGWIIREEVDSFEPDDEDELGG